MKVAIFGGSFDPFHIGHLNLCVELLDFYNEVWVIPAHNSYDKVICASMLERIEMISLATIAYDNIKVVDVVSTINSSYTFDLVTYLQSKYDHEFTFVLGSDSLEHLDKWYRYEDLVNSIDFEVVNRQGYTRVESARIEIMAYSSSIAKIARNTKIESVNTYIMEHDLYNYELYPFVEYVSHLMIKDKRFIHTLGVVDLAVKLANAYNVSKQDAFLCALYHDIYKGTFTNAQQLQLFNELDCEFKVTNISLMHGFLAAELFDKNQCLSKYNAIRFHTSAYDEIDLLGKIIFIADKLEEGRLIKNRDRLVAEAFKDINKSFEELFKQETLYYINNGCADDECHQWNKKLMEELIWNS